MSVTPDCFDGGHTSAWLGDNILSHTNTTHTRLLCRVTAATYVRGYTLGILTLTVHVARFGRVLHCLRYACTITADARATNGFQLWWTDCVGWGWVGDSVCCSLLPESAGNCAS
jgi:hypothetical protein